MSARWLEELNEAQHTAVTYGDGPLLIVAGAGTGKTRTLACRVADLLGRGVPADRILLLTFTRRAAAEMISRAEQMSAGVASAGGGRVWGGTFHAVANRLLRMYGSAIGLPPSFTVLDASDAADLINLIRSELEVAKGDRRFPRKDTLLAIYSRSVNAGEKLADTLTRHFPWCKNDEEAIAAIFRQYVTRKRVRGLLDYDDLLLYWRALLATPQVGPAVAERFDHVLVDEYQDTNPIQAEIVQALRSTCCNVCVVGDDAQAIYSFRSATIRNILDFPTQFPGTRVVMLEQNYRSMQPILDAANAVMAPARERYTKQLWSTRTGTSRPQLVRCDDEADQCEAVCRGILAHYEQGTALMRQAVLFRAGHHSDMLEVELSRRKIPFRKYGGLKFVETAHIKDLLAFLRILDNPCDEVSWFRVLQLFEGLGARSARRITAALGLCTGTDLVVAATAADGIPAVSPLQTLLYDPPRVPPRARDDFAGLRGMVAACLGLRLGAEGRPEAAGPPRESVPPFAAQVALVRRFYEPLCARNHENAAARLRDLEQLEQIAAEYRSATQFLADLALDPPQTAADFAGPPELEEDYLILSTIHSAKGCEWDVVHVIHAADGMVPSDMALEEPEGLEEERRLFYVALTRARNNLYVYFPLRYHFRRSRTSDKHTFAQRTRFLTEDVARKCFEARYSARSDALVRVPAANGGAEVERWLQRLWSNS